MAYVFDFDHSHDQAPMFLKDLLGGKGANLAEMSSVLKLPVPPGFTISTEACKAYLGGGWPDGLDDEIAGALSRLEAAMGRKLGDAHDPLLVSVRSGAKFSMPGMMDTVLNLGLNDRSVEGLATATDDIRFAYDSYRRFVALYGRIVLDVPGEEFDEALERAKTDTGVATDSEIPAERLRDLVEEEKAIVERHIGGPFPQEPVEQLRGAIEAVFSSWNGARAVAYRVRERIPHDLGTAVNVQAMVFGNRDDQSGTGVGFTRDPATGEQGAYGDYLINAQGEDVVAGIRNTQPLAALKDHFPDIYDELLGIYDRLEHHYRDMCDTEFTIEQAKLWMLQTRVGKRNGVAALKMAVDMTSEEDLGVSHEEAVTRVSADHLDQVLHPQFAGSVTAIAKGLGVSPGAGVGRVYFTADDAADAADRGEKVVLVRSETSPEDVHGMIVAEGILTTRGGSSSHAAVVARGWGKPAVVGAESIRIEGKQFSVGDNVVKEGDVISIDGATGEVVLGEVDVVAGEAPPEFYTLLSWADEIRAGHLKVRANADNGPDSANGRQFGAEGIGLCRTEHMFLAEDRLPIVRRMILANDEDSETAALEELRVAQKADFEEILEAMDGLPVCVRLLDPPLHEFLPSAEALRVKEAKEGKLSDEDRALLRAAEEWHEFNPMLGTRGVRLGIVKPGLYGMQVRALLEACRARKDAGGNPIVEVMIPLTVTREELAFARQWVEDAIAEYGTDVGEVTIGTMVETPRAALRADELAEVADFFSFGTNDLTQMTFGFSRDDVEGRMMSTYLEHGLLKRNPFDTIDQSGVGELVRIGAERGRKSNPDIKLGICGEHGGDPESIQLFYDAGLDYVSCSPFRVPIARLAAAQAVLARR